MWLFNVSLFGEPPHCLPDWLYQFAFPPTGWEGSPLSGTLSASNFIRGNRNSVGYTQGQESSCRIHPKAPDTKPLEATNMPLSTWIPRLSFWLHHQRNDRENMAPQNIEIIHLVKLESRAQLLNFRKRPLWVISYFPSTLIFTLLMKKLINDETSPLSNDIIPVCIRWRKATSSRCWPLNLILGPIEETPLDEGTN